MPEFRYRLQTLLDQRIQRKENRQKALANVERQLRNEQDELEACAREQRDCLERLRHARFDAIRPDPALSNGAWMQIRRDHLSKLREDYDASVDAAGAQELRVREAEDRVAAARAALAAASLDVEILEKHRERLRSRFERDAQTKEALDQEEMANLVYLQGRGAR